MRSETPAALFDQRLEVAAPVVVVARVDAHLVGILRGGIGHGRLEVDVGHQGHVGPAAVHLPGDAPQTFGLAETLGGEPDDVSARLADASDLFDAGLHVVGVAVGHRLYGYGAVAADAGRADGDLAAEASCRKGGCEPGGAQFPGVLIIHGQVVLFMIVAKVVQIAGGCQSTASMRRMGRAGTPPTIVSAGTSFVTTAPAATTALSPIVTPERIVALEPTQTLRPSTMGAG